VSEIAAGEIAQGGVAKMRALMKHMAKEKVGTSSTNTLQNMSDLINSFLT